MDGQYEIDKAHQQEIERAYIHAYTAAEQDLSTQLTAYREALRELVESLEGFHVENMGMSREVAKAKILLNPSCEDVDKKE